MKYYLYIDECGDQNLANFDEQFPIFTLCGIVVEDSKRAWLEEQIHALKQEFWGNQYTILHSRDIRKCQRGFEILFDLDVKRRFYERVNAILGTKGIKKELSELTTLSNRGHPSPDSDSRNVRGAKVQQKNGMTK